MSKNELYETLTAQVDAMIESSDHIITNLSNLSALLNECIDDINWVGFYLAYNGELILGPFQGKPACTHIKSGKGVCGTAFVTGQTQCVKNVHEFSGHIACDCNTNSEIVVPLIVNDKVLAVLDIDSTTLARFDETDTRYLNKIGKIISDKCRWDDI